MSYKNKLDYIILTYICLFMIFIVTVVTSNGFARMLMFIIAISFFAGITRKVENTIFLIVAILPNTELLTGSFMGISISKMVFFVCFMYIAIRYSSPQKRDRILVPVWFYIIWIIYIVGNQVVVTGNVAIQSIISIFGMMLISMTMQILVNDNQTKAEKYILMIFIGFSFIVIIAYVELLLGKTFFYSLWTGAERYRYGIMRVGSTVADPNNVCYYLVPFFFWTNINEVKRVIPHYFRVIVQIMTIFMIFLTSSRSGLVALLIGLFFCFFGRKKLVLLFTIPIIAAISNYLLVAFETLMNSAAESTNFRNYIIEQCLLQWNSNRMFGVGINNIMKSIGYETAALNTMNTFVFMLTGLGFVGLILYILYWIFMVKYNIVDWIKNKKVEDGQLYAIACIFTILIIAYTLDTFYMMLMWVMPAMIMAAYRKSEVETKK